MPTSPLKHINELVAIDSKCVQSVPPPSFSDEAIKQSLSVDCVGCLCFLQNNVYKVVNIYMVGCVPPCPGACLQECKNHLSRKNTLMTFLLMHRPNRVSYLRNSCLQVGTALLGRTEDSFEIPNVPMLEDN